MSSTEVSKNFRRTNPGPLDALYGPYPNATAACAAIPNTDKLVDGVVVNFRQGQVVGIIDINSQSILNYSWAGPNFDDAGLKPVFNDLTAATEVISARVSTVEADKADKSSTYTKMQIDQAIIALSPDSEVLVPIFESKESSINKNQPGGYPGLNEDGFLDSEKLADLTAFSLNNQNLD